MANHNRSATLEIDAGPVCDTTHPHDGEHHGGILETMKEKAMDVASGASEMMSGAKDKVQEWASDAVDAAGVVKDKTQEFASAAAHKAGDFGAEVTSLMRRYPIPTLLVGFGIGILAARMIKRD
jgi:hypothetical protein